MKVLNVKQCNTISGAMLDINMADCYQAKSDAVALLLGPDHYDILDVTDSLHISCPMEYPDKFSALNAAIEPFMMNPTLL